uniref:NAC domain-containing protein n=1 Tax=Leersia perrieri TaxID=77586 RepID=A0A0D9WBN3_9ORYZ
MAGALNDKEINHTYVKVLSQMPYFRRSGGRDHIFVFPSGAGAHLFRSWATFLNRSIILTPEGDRTDKRGISAFNTWKDIIIPGNVDDSMVNPDKLAVKPIPLTKRKYLANFLGRAQGKVGRLQLVKLAKQYPDKLESPELKFSGPDKLGRIDYFKHLRNAKFCLAPRGESSWTLRFYESFFVNVIDYTEVSIKWPASKIGLQLLEYLESIPDERVEEMIGRGREIRCLWVYAPDTEPCSAMSAIMWELERKMRRFHQSAETFWLHNRSIVNRDLVEFHQWRTPKGKPRPPGEGEDESEGGREILRLTATGAASLPLLAAARRLFAGQPAAASIRPASHTLLRVILLLPRDVRRHQHRTTQLGFLPSLGAGLPPFALQMTLDTRKDYLCCGCSRRQHSLFLTMAKTSLPPGFRFHPTDVELTVYYLKRKLLGKHLRCNAASECDLYKFAPWDLPEKSSLQSKDREWYFFCPRDKKYSSGSRTNRSTEAGYWKATGKDRPVIYKSQTVGMKRTLVFHLGKPPRGGRTDWVMYEYRLEDKELSASGIKLDACVLCKIFQKSGPGPKIGEQYGAPFNEEDWNEANAEFSSFTLSVPSCALESIIGRSNRAGQQLPVSDNVESSLEPRSEVNDKLTVDGVCPDMSHTTSPGTPFDSIHTQQLAEIISCFSTDILNSAGRDGSLPDSTADYDNDNEVLSDDGEAIFDELDEFYSQSDESISNHCDSCGEDSVQPVLEVLETEQYLELNDLSFSLADDPDPCKLLLTTNLSDQSHLELETRLEQESLVDICNTSTISTAGMAPITIDVNQRWLCRCHFRHVVILLFAVYGSAFYSSSMKAVFRF